MNDGHAPEVVVLTGAGISAESGLPTFRGPDGLWEGHRVEEVATPEAFARDPELVHRFYNERRRRLRDPGVQPNPAHLALARLERRLGQRLLLVTQNVDDLHERAGSGAVLHMHGALLRARCTGCGEARSWAGDLSIETVCEVCASRGRMRPDIVWFGEMPVGMDRITAALGSCRLFVAIGTSGQVYPAAAFVAEARAAGADTLELNLVPSATDRTFAERRYGPASELVPAWVEELLRTEPD